MKRIFLAVPIIAVSASAQVTATAPLNTNLTPATVQQLQKQTATQQAAIIRAYLAAYAQQRVVDTTNRSASTLKRQSLLQARLQAAGTRYSFYRLSTDPATGQIVIASEPDPIPLTEMVATNGNPIIQSIDVSSITPGSSVTINGANFQDPGLQGQSPGKVLFTLPGGSVLTGQITLWSRSAIQAVLTAQISGVLAGTASISVVLNPSGQSSNAFNVNFTPIIDAYPMAMYRLLDVNSLGQPCGYDAFGNHLDWYGWAPANDGIPSDVSPTGYEYIHVEHDGGKLLGCGPGEDHPLRSQKLLNQWVVDSYPFAKFTRSSNLATNDAYINNPPGTGVGTNDPYVDVHWYADANQGVTYCISVIVKGPRGTLYIP